MPLGFLQTGFGCAGDGIMGIHHAMEDLEDGPVFVQSRHEEMAAYMVEVTQPQQLPMAVDRARRSDMARGSVAAIIIAADVQEQEYEEPTHDFRMCPAASGWRSRRSPRRRPPSRRRRRSSTAVNVSAS